MNIASILLVGVSDDAVKGQLSQRGYAVLTVPDIPAISRTTEPYALLIISQQTLGPVNESMLEKLRFLGDQSPLAVLIDNRAELDNALLTALRNGSLEYIFTSEITLGLLSSRIDALFVSTQINRQVQSLQHNLGEKKSLERELVFRDKVLQRQRSLNECIVNSITSGLIILDLDGTILMANDHASAILSLQSKSLTGAYYFNVLPPAMVSIVKTSFTTVKKHPPLVARKFRLGSRYLELSAYHLVDQSDEMSGIILLVSDITQSEQTSLALYQAEKLTTIGTMLSGIAHELRNPLSIISARSQRALVKKDFSPDWIARAFLSIQKQAQRCAALINNLLDFTHKNEMASGYHDLSAIMDETLSYASYQQRLEYFTIGKHYKDGISVFGDRSRFIQVFLNVVLNALDVMSAGGKLTLTTSAADGFAQVEINDTGPGIDISIQEYIFDPFFTTKDTGKGTGLGLAIAYKILQDSGGSVRFETRPGNTSFFIKIPTESESVHDVSDSPC